MHTLPSGARCALFLAHPGHELVVHSFVEKARPVVAILTDGSGLTEKSRVGSTTRFLEPAGASPAPLYARYNDRRCYAALLARDADFFTGIAEELASFLAGSQIDTVVGDAREGWNPVHDIWRSVVNLAVVLARRRARRDIRNFDFLLFRSHQTVAGDYPHESIVFELDDASYRRKMTTATMYTELHDEVLVALRGTTAAMVPPHLSRDLDARLGGLNAESYRVEVLRPVDEQSPPTETTPRVYELYGEMVVAEGRYQEVIRHDRHLLPIETAMRQHAAREAALSHIC